MDAPNSLNFCRHKIGLSLLKKKNVVTIMIHIDITQPSSDECCQPSLKLHMDLSNEINKHITPLLNDMGLTHFVYTRFQSGRKYMLLVNNHEDLERFFSKHLDRYFMKQDFSILPQGRYYVFWPYAPSNPMLNSLKDWNIWNGFSILERDSASVEGFHFATTTENQDILDLYMNQRGLLDSFIIYFLEKLNSALRSHGKLPFWTYPDEFRLDLDQKSRFVKTYDAIRNSITLKKYNVSYNGITSTLTKRHLDLINAVSKGKSDKEIAQLYELSPRTIESYLINIRNKYNLSGRNELVDLWEANPLLASLYF